MEKRFIIDIHAKVNCKFKGYNMAPIEKKYIQF